MILTSRHELLYSRVLHLSTPSNIKRYKSGKIAYFVITDTHRGVVVAPYGVEGQCVPKGPPTAPVQLPFLGNQLPTIGTHYTRLHQARTHLVSNFTLFRVHGIVSPTTHKKQELNNSLCSFVGSYLRPRSSHLRAYICKLNAFASLHL